MGISAPQSSERERESAPLDAQRSHTHISSHGHPSLKSLSDGQHPSSVRAPRQAGHALGTLICSGLLLLLSPDSLAVPTLVPHAARPRQLCDSQPPSKPPIDFLRSSKIVSSNGAEGRATNNIATSFRVAVDTFGWKCVIACLFFSSFICFSSCSSYYYYVIAQATYFYCCSS